MAVLPTLRYFLLQNCLGKTSHFSTGFSLGVSLVMNLMERNIWRFSPSCKYLPAGLDRLDLTGLLGNCGDGDLLFLMTFLLLLLVTAACSTERPGHSATLGDPQRTVMRSQWYFDTTLTPVSISSKDINANIYFLCGTVVPCLCAYQECETELWLYPL